MEEAVIIDVIVTRRSPPTTSPSGPARSRVKFSAP